MGDVDGQGRPREVGRLISHAYVLRVVAEFQAFVRDLHDLAAERIIYLAVSQAEYRPLLIGAATEARYIDRGNADLRASSRTSDGWGWVVSTGRLELSTHVGLTPTGEATGRTTRTSSSFETPLPMETRSSWIAYGLAESPTP